MIVRRVRFGVFPTLAIRPPMTSWTIRQQSTWKLAHILNTVDSPDRSGWLRTYYDAPLPWDPTKNYDEGPRSSGGIGAAIGNVVGAVVGTTSMAAASIDPTANKSLVGQLIGPTGTSLVKQAVATSAAMVTGGISVGAGEVGLVSKDVFGAKTTAKGFMTGAAAGLAILSGKKITDMLGSKQPSTSAGSAVPSDSTGEPAATPGFSWGPILAGLGAGFLVGGPVGAAVGGAAGGILASRKPAQPVSGFGRYGRAADAVIEMRLHRRRR